MSIGVNVGDIIGYISKGINPKGYFLREAKVTAIRLCKTGTRVYSKEFSPLDLKEIQVNTEWLLKNDKIILVQEPFLLAPSLRPRIANWCEKVTQNPNEVELYES